MTARAERIERIRDLLEQQRHPERRVGIFSATNLTRLVLRFGALGIATALIHAGLGGTLLEVPVAAIAVAGADRLTTQLWRRIEGSVQQAWTVVGLTLGTIGLLLALAGPDGPMKTVRGWLDGWLTSQNAALDRRAAGEEIPIAADAASGPDWRIIVRNGMIRRGTLEEARHWCAGMGPEWALPPGLGEWPALSSYPDLGTLLYAWTAAGSGVQIGDGRKPAAGVSGSGRATEVQAVLCLQGGK